MYAIFLRSSFPLTGTDFRAIPLEGYCLFVYLILIRLRLDLQLKDGANLLNVRGRKGLGEFETLVGVLFQLLSNTAEHGLAESYDE
jgi:hypothetical protein